MPSAGRIPHATRPNEGFEQQADLTAAGMFHFAVPGNSPCSTCVFFGFVSRRPSPTRNYRCRKAWRAGVRKRFAGDQPGCKYHEPRPEKVKRVRKAKVTV